MRVLMLTSSYPKARGDGTAPFIERIVLQVARRGHAVDVVLPRHPDLVTEGRAGDLPVRFHPHACGPAGWSVWGYASSMRADRRLRPAAWVVAPLALFSALATLRRLTARTAYDLVHVHWLLPNGPVAARAAAAAGLPLVVSLHGSDVFVAERNRLLRALGRWVLRRSRWVIACSGDLARRVRALAPDGPECEVVPYGVDAAELRGGDPQRWRERAGVAAGDFVVAGLGRLVAKKGFSRLIEAAGILVRAGMPLRVVLGGAGDLTEELVRRARRQDCGARISFVGAVPHDQVGAFLSAADVVVVPSVRDERGNVDGLPNVLLEALAVGRPVVSSRVGGIPDVIEDGQNGLLVPPGDAAALAEALARLHGDEGLRRRIALAAEQTAGGLSWERYGERLMAGYERVRSGGRER
jgi:glycosyltransferase involved in cell wall biosynthesis